MKGRTRQRDLHGDDTPDGPGEEAPLRGSAERHLPTVAFRRYAVPMMRDEERYWVKVSLTVGFVVLALLLLLISGMIGNMERIVTGILRAVE